MIHCPRCNGTRAGAALDENGQFTSSYMVCATCGVILRVIDAQRNVAIVTDAEIDALPFHEVIMLAAIKRMAERVQAYERARRN